MGSRTMGAFRIGSQAAWPLAAMLAALLLFVLPGWFPASAYAREYACPSVSIDASIGADGTLSVTEVREFSFDGDAAALRWAFGNLPSNECELTVGSVVMSAPVQAGAARGESAADGEGQAAQEEDADGEGSNGDEGSDGGEVASIEPEIVEQELPQVPFDTAWRTEGNPGKAAYAVDDDRRTVYVFPGFVDSEVTIAISYTITNFAQAYNDVAEVYWQFVGDGWPVDSEHVTAVLRLPAPAGQSVSGNDETVRAWLHGSNDGSVRVQDDGSIALDVPSVEAGGYAEVRAIFPTEWLSALSSSSSAVHAGDRLDAILSDENRLANQGSAERLRSLALIVGCLIVSVGVIAWALLMFFRHGREHRPRFQERYWRAVPEEGLHPAVVSRLWRWDGANIDALSATLMRLSRRGVLRIDAGSYEVATGDSAKTVDDYYLVRLPGWSDKVAGSAIDRKAIELVFDIAGEGSDAVWFGTVSGYGQRRPRTFAEAVKAWQDTVELEVDARSFFEAKGTQHQAIVTAVGAFMLAAGIAAAFFTGSLIPLVSFAPASVALVVMGWFMKCHSPDAVELHAKCEGLRTWLRDLDTLDERLSDDVKAWGEILVYAYLFGMGEQVVGTLKARVPSLAQDEGFASACTWASRESADSPLDGAGETFSLMMRNTLASAK